MWDRLTPIDEAADHAWEPLRKNRAINKIMVAATNAGEHGLLWIGLALVQAAVRYKRGDRYLAKAYLTRFLVAITAESILVNGGLKSLTRRPRPANGSERAEGVRMPLSSSMPSGHATSAVMSGVLLADGVRSAPERAAIYTAAGTVALSRHHVRIHHFTDVAAGALLGWLLGTATRSVFPISEVDDPHPLLPQTRPEPTN
jgi:undecaprenyl-diphosphatase